MSVPVALEQLRGAVAERRSPPFLLTVSDDGRPHSVSIGLGWDDDRLAGPCGRTSARNASARPTVSVLWPPDAAGDYALIVDGTATVDTSDDGGRVWVAPERAILHRTTPGHEPGTTGASHDCVKLLD